MKNLFSHAHTSVASVDGNGVVTGIKEGETELEVSSADGPKATAKLTVTKTVWIAMPQSSYSWDMKVAGSGHSDGWKCVPILDESLKDAKITFKTDDTGIAKVSKDGTVTCYCKPGATVLTATAEKDGQTYTAKMNIYVNGGSLDLKPVQSADGKGRSKEFVYFYGCTCAETGNPGQLTYTGTYTRWLNGQKTVMDITDKNCPKLSLALGGEYFETAGNGRLSMKDKCGSVTKYTDVEIVLCGSDNGADILLDDDGCGFTVTLEPTMKPSAGDKSFITDLMYINAVEYNCFVLDNGFPCTLKFNTKISDIKNDSGYFTAASAKDSYTYAFTVKGADGGATKINSVVYSLGGQKMTFHIFADKPTNYISWANPKGTLKVGDTTNAKPTIDSVLENCTGGTKVKYEVVSGDAVTVDGNGKVTAVKGGEASVRVTVSYAGSSTTTCITYNFWVQDVYSLRMTLSEAAYLYYNDGKANSVSYKVELCKLVNGKPEFVKDITKDPGVSIARYMGGVIEAKNGQIYMKKSVEELCDDLLNAVYTYNGETLSSNQVRVNCEPPVKRPSVYSNVGFGDAGFGNCFLIMNPAEEFQLRFSRHRCAQFAVMSGSQYVENIYMDSNGEFITLKMNIADNSQRVVVRFWTYGGQYYDGTFSVH